VALVLAVVAVGVPVLLILSASPPGAALAVRARPVGDRAYVGLLVAGGAILAVLGRDLWPVVTLGAALLVAAAAFVVTGPTAASRRPEDAPRSADWSRVTSVAALTWIPFGYVVDDAVRHGPSLAHLAVVAGSGAAALIVWRSSRSPSRSR
jgi:threonine/homoserine efflux transporter RhtA